MGILLPYISFQYIHDPRCRCNNSIQTDQILALRYKGINPQNILVSDLNTAELKKSFSAICDEIEKIPGVIRAAGGSYIPPFGNYLPINLSTPEGEKVRFDGLIMGKEMTEFLGIEIKEGESFGELSPSRAF